MRNHQERRSGIDRREPAIACVGSSGRRIPVERREPEAADDTRPGDGCEITPDCWGASEDESSDE